MNRSNHYVKIVEWSDEDQCYVGNCPEFFCGGCHGGNEQKVFVELCRIFEKTIDLHQRDGRPLPSATSGKDYPNKMLPFFKKALHLPANLHE